MLKYFYDSNGDIRFLLSKADNFKNQDAYNLYYYVKDGLGNITGLIRVKAQSGSSAVLDQTLVAEYKYDPYGKIESVTRPSGITDDIYQINPIRYKSYYYDSDSGWYNLKTRYYDPVIARFINADDVSLITLSPGGFTDKNLYAYCDNNPISRRDVSGNSWQIILGAALTGGLLGAGFEFACQMIERGRVENGWAIGVAGMSGAASGVSTATGAVVATFFGAIWIDRLKGKTWTEAATSGATAATFGLYARGLTHLAYGGSVKDLGKSVISSNNRMKSLVQSMFNPSAVGNTMKNYFTSFSRTSSLIDKIFFSSFLNFMIFLPLKGIMTYLKQ